MDGQICVVTGANSGIGRAMATELARRGAQVVMVSRNEDAAAPVLTELRKLGRAEPILELSDLSLMSQVRSLAERLRSRFSRIDVLMNNAGTYLGKRYLTEEGHETSFAVNHLAPFLLTNLLRDRLSGGRVVITSSNAYKSAALDIDDLGMEKKWKPLTQYANAKLGTVLFMREAVRRFEGSGIRINCFHPGGVRSGMAQDDPNFIGTIWKLMGFMLRSPEKGAETGIYLAADPAAGELNGQYLVDRKIQAIKGPGADDELAGRLWAKSADLVGLAD